MSFTVKVALLLLVPDHAALDAAALRYDQLMRLGWKGLLPLGFLNAIVTALVILAATSH